MIGRLQTVYDRLAGAAIAAASGPFPAATAPADPDGLVFFLPIRGRHHRGRYQLAGDQATILLWFSGAKEWAGVWA